MARKESLRVADAVLARVEDGRGEGRRGVPLDEAGAKVRLMKPEDRPDEIRPELIELVAERLEDGPAGDER